MDRRQAIETLGESMPDTIVDYYVTMQACMECVDSGTPASLAPLGLYAGTFFRERRESAARKPGYLFQSNV